MVATNNQKIIYNFEDGNARMRDTLGGKGANLAEMTRLGIPVPPGFIITTEVSRAYQKTSNKETFMQKLENEVRPYLEELELKLGRKLGAKEKPLLLSVRSGAPISMPGMMDTILNLGVNDETVTALARETDPRFAYDCYRRFIQMFADVVLGVSKAGFEGIIEEVKEELEVKLDSEVPAEGWKTIVARYKQYLNQLDEVIPEDPFQCLIMAVEAVLKSWSNKRAITYRRFNNIPHTIGTAVNIQVMVFGNSGD
ncbi:MAG: PEP/pyruvate-binding domain-containing protein, partial [Promethearchaeota archaeon]